MIVVPPRKNDQAAITVLQMVNDSSMEVSGGNLRSGIINRIELEYLFYSSVDFQ